MQIKLWGVRGSLPAPLTDDGLHEKLKGALAFAKEVWKKDPALDVEEVLQKVPPASRTVIGGNTTCVEFVDENTILIFDMGTGARELGYDLVQRYPDGAKIHIMMTHTHWDHIQGWPFFTPAFIPSFQIHFHSMLSDLEERYNTQQRFEFFPVAMDNMSARKSFHTFRPGESFSIDHLTIQTAALIHPGGSIAYRVDNGKKSFLFATDTEFYGPELSLILDRYDSLFHGVDLLVMDAQYSILEAGDRIGWGHTALYIAIDCALHWEVKKLILTHHEPAHTDERIFELYENGMKYMRLIHGDKAVSCMDVELGMERGTYEI